TLNATCASIVIARDAAARSGRRRAPTLGDLLFKLGRTGSKNTRPMRTCPLLCRFSDAGNDEASQQARMPASEKRQGTKSRGSRLRRCRGLYGDLATASGWARSDRKCLRLSLCCEGRVWVTGGTSDAGGSEEDWRSHWARFI